MYVCVYAWVFSCVQLIVTPWTVCSSPGSSVHGVLQTRILEWVTIPFSRTSSQPRDWTWISCTAGRFFTVWATRDAHVGFPAYTHTTHHHPFICHLGCFHVLAILNSAMQIGVHISFWIIVLLEICPGVGLLNHMAALFFVSWGTSLLFSMVAAPTYIAATAAKCRKDLKFPNQALNLVQQLKCQVLTTGLPGTSQILGKRSRVTLCCATIDHQEGKGVAFGSTEKFSSFSLNNKVNCALRRNLKTMDWRTAFYDMF